MQHYLCPNCELQEKKIQAFLAWILLVLASSVIQRIG